MVGKIVTVKPRLEQQKRAAVIDLCSRRESAREVAQTAGISHQTLYNWKDKQLGREALTSITLPSITFTMTLIARLNSQKLPVLVGDIAESKSTDKVIAWPTLGSSAEVFPAGSGYALSGYTQKTSVLCGSLALAWAGTKIYARFLEQELVQALQDDNSFATVQRVLQEQADVIEEHLSLVGTYLEPVSEGRLTFINFQVDSKTVESAQFGLCELGGTGLGVALGQIEAHVGLPPEDFCLPGARADAVHKALALTTALLYEEHTNHAPLYHYTGGAYEIVYIENGRFCKLDNHATALWSVEINVQGEPYDLYLHSVSNCAYHGDVYAISHLRTSHPTATGANVETFDHFLAGPLSRALTQQEVDAFRPRLAPTTFTHIVEIIYPGQALRKLRVTEHQNPQAINFVDTKGLISITVNKALILDQISQFERRRRPAQES